MDTEFEVKNPLAEKTAWDRWLTERYCLYLDKKEAIYRYDIHHKEWEIKRVELKRLNLNYKNWRIRLNRQIRPHALFKRGGSGMEKNKNINSEAYRATRFTYHL